MPPTAAALPDGKALGVNDLRSAEVQKQNDADS